MYWLVAGTGKLAGHVNEFVARFPSALAAVLSCAAMIFFLRKWLSLRTALICASIWTTTLAYARCSHNARPEMLMTFFVVVCFLSFYAGFTAEKRSEQIRYMLIFWVSLGLGNIAKGPAPLALVGVPLFVYVAVYRKWRTIPKLLPIVGPLIAFAIMLPWPLAIAYKLNWDLTLWKHEFFDRFFGDYAKGNYPLYYYAGIIWK